MKLWKDIDKLETETRRNPSIVRLAFDDLSDVVLVKNNVGGGMICGCDTFDIYTIHVVKDGYSNIYYMGQLVERRKVLGYMFGF